MKKRSRRICVLTAALALLFTGSAAALLSAAPIAREVELATYRDLSVEGQFLSTDPAAEFVLEEAPEKGTVTVEGDTFTYTPRAGKTGTDRFTYTAVSANGAASAPAEVTVSVRRPRSGVTYADTRDAAAQHLAETGVFTGANIGGQFYFEPDRTVSRSEFLAMVLETTSAEVTEVTMTGFCDDAAIPAWARSYAAAGVSQGIVQGERAGEGVAFRGEDAITRSEAAVMLDRALAVSDVDLAVWYADREAVPSWAAQAVGNLESVNVLSAGSFGSAALEEPVTRMEAARMLSAAATLLEGREEGILSWLW